MNKNEITPENLLENGWIKTDDFPYLFEKKIENRNPINSTPEDTDISLIVHRMYNTPAFAVAFPDGAMLNFEPANMDELNLFEKMITFFDASY